jgi:hypothetical protein
LKKAVCGPRIRQAVFGPQSSEAGLVFLTCGLLERGGVFWRHCRFLAREQVFDGDYLKAREFPERGSEHTSTGGLFFHRSRGLGKLPKLSRFT